MRFLFSAFCLLLLSCADPGVCIEKGGRIVHRIFHGTVYHNWFDKKDLLIQTYPSPTLVDSFMARKARKILKKLNKQYSNPPGYWQQYEIGGDTLIDLNGDDSSDLLFEYSNNFLDGVTINQISVYLFDKRKKDFVFNKQLSGIENPFFNFGEQTVCGSAHYGCSGSIGDAVKLKWNKNKMGLDTIEYFNFRPKSYDPMEWTFTYSNYTVNQKQTKIYESSAVRLPKEYCYFNYRSLIKRKS